jgi:hypothetical protein
MNRQADAEQAQSDARAQQDDARREHAGPEGGATEPKERGVDRRCPSVFLKPDMPNRHVTLRQLTKRLVPRPVRVWIRSSFSYWRSVGRPALFTTARLALLNTTRPALLNTARWVTRPIATDTSLDPYHRVVERFFAEASKSDREASVGNGRPAWQTGDRRRSPDCTPNPRSDG